MAMFAYDLQWVEIVVTETVVERAQSIACLERAQSIGDAQEALPDESYCFFNLCQPHGHHQ